MKTPVLIINRDVLMRNLERMQSIADAHSNLSLRPHIKTHKSVELAKIQLKLGAVGITCAKLDEAKAMAASGAKDVFLAYPFADPEKIRDAIQFSKSLERFIFSVDTVAGARLLDQVASEQGVIVEARVEVETGLHRTGFLSSELQQAVPVLASLKHIDFTGVYTYRGSKNRSGIDVKDTQAAGREESSLVVNFAEELRAGGLKIRDISVGSTPTLKGVVTNPQITEIRPGTYIFNDAMQVAYGVCAQSDCAAAVRVTVVSLHGDRAVIDGGSKTFATDVQPTNNPVVMEGFGIIKGHPAIKLVHMNEEHGVLALNGDHLTQGQTLDIIPNHICSTVNLYDQYYFDDGTPIVTSARGKIQ